MAQTATAADYRTILSTEKLAGKVKYKYTLLRSPLQAFGDDRPPRPDFLTVNAPNAPCHVCTRV
jgi:hypothetical protein